MPSIRKTIEDSMQAYDSIVVWGAGGLGRMSMKKWLPKDKVTYVVDTYCDDSNATLMDKPVRNSLQAEQDAPDCIVICSVAYLEIWEEIKESGYTGKVFYIYELMANSKELSQMQMLCLDILATKNDNWLRFLLMKPQILVNMSFRLAKWLDGKWYTLPFYWLAFFIHSIVCVIFSIQLPVQTTIGPGLVFAHYGTIVFTARAKIGAFFTIYHGCTVGTDDTGHGPQIGDFVTQYAGTHLLGKSRIGSHCRIGANSTVVSLECEEGYATIAGSPAKVKRKFKI